jgi:predicted transcriptional regulator
MKKMIGLKVDPKIKKNLEELAEAESRSLANFCYHAIKIYAQEHHGVDIKKGVKK